MACPHDGDMAGRSAEKFISGVRARRPHAPRLRSGWQRPRAPDGPKAAGQPCVGGGTITLARPADIAALDQSARSTRAGLSRTARAAGTSDAAMATASSTMQMSTSISTGAIGRDTT